MTSPANPEIKWPGVSPAISLFGTYVFNRSRSNTEGANTFPGNPYSLVGEFGPAGNDVHHRVNAGGSINTKWNVRLSPLVTLQTGQPFDITTGGDPYGTTLFNARPGIGANPAKPGLIPTAYGLLDPNPDPGETLLTRNYGRGPGQMMVNLRVAKTFGFGPERKSSKPGGIFAAPSERRYSLIFSMAVRNILNHTNSGPIFGNITSPLFGRANQMAGNNNAEGFSENANNLFPQNPTNILWLRKQFSVAHCPRNKIVGIAGVRASRLLPLIPSAHYLFIKVRHC
jgi:hypothetical protein